MTFSNLSTEECRILCIRSIETQPITLVYQIHMCPEQNCKDKRLNQYPLILKRQNSNQYPYPPTELIQIYVSEEEKKNLNNSENVLITLLYLGGNSWVRLGDIKFPNKSV